MLRRKTDIHFDVLDVIDTTDNIHTVDLGERIQKVMTEKIDEYKNKK